MSPVKYATDLSIAEIEDRIRDLGLTIGEIAKIDREEGIDPHDDGVLQVLGIELSRLTHVRRHHWGY